MYKNNQKEFYSKLELAMKLGICTRTLDNLIRDGRISYLKVGSRVIFSQQDLDTFIERNRRDAYGVSEESLKNYLN